MTKMNETPEHKALKREAHRLANIVWYLPEIGDVDTGAMYVWMQAHTVTGHIATLSVLELKKLIKELKPMAKRNNRV